MNFIFFLWKLLFILSLNNYWLYYLKLCCIIQIKIFKDVKNYNNYQYILINLYEIVKSLRDFINIFL